MQCQQTGNKGCIAKSRKKLEDYEEKLGLVARVTKIKDKIQNYISEADAETAAKLDKLLQEVEKI